MVVKYIAPPQNNPANQNVVFNDNALPLEHALAYRKVVNPDSLVFTAQSPQELMGVLQVLSAVKQNAAINPQHAVPSLVQQGYLNAQGNVIDPTFSNRVRNNPHIEIILDNAVLVLDKNGMAYIHSKGDPIDPQLSQALQQQFWPRFYNKAPNLAQGCSHFHSGVKQQEDNYSGVDWALANLNIFCRTLNADTNTLKNAEKINRQQLINRINGQPNPRDPRAPFNLIDRSNESQNEREWKKRKKQLRRTETRHTLFHTEAEEAQQAAQAEGRIHAFRADPRNSWVEVLLAPPPDYNLGSDLNKFNTTRDNGMKNEFELKENNLIVKATGGEVTYQERFERIAEDLRSVFVKEDRSNLPIIIRGVKPASKQAECLAAFEKLYGVGNVIIRDPGRAPDDGPPVDPDAIGARPL